DAATTLDADHGSGTQNLTSSEIRGLADDPDDFKHQLQVLASSGGAAGTAIVSVDGFQNNSTLPPKSAIASIRINPDLYSAEYAKPPYQGGRIEIFTRPGTEFEGAAFFAGTNSILNANNSLAQSGNAGTGGN